jgi:hypothetical protein
MDLLRRAVLSILAAALCANATAVELIAGPWVILTPGGGARIGAEWSVAQELPARAIVRLSDQLVSLAAEQRPCRRTTEETSVITDVVVSPKDFHPGPFRWDIAGRTLAGVLPTLPGTDAPVRVAVVGMHNYPDGPSLGRLGTVLGGPIDAVIVAGPDRLRVAGRGGWEHAIPLLFLGDAASDMALDAIAPASRWPHGIAWGCLGLSCAQNDADWPMAIPSQLTAWRIPVMPEARWNPGLLAPSEHHGAEGLRSLIALAAGLQVPCILQCGGRSGFISEPLLNQSGTLRSLEGGVRIIGATPSGEGLAGLAEAIATPLPGTAVIGLNADLDRLLLGVGGGEEPPVELVWERSAIGELSGPGTGEGDVVAAWRAWREGQEFRLASAAWAAIPTLQRITPTREDNEALLASSAGGAGRIAARRFLGRPDGGPLPENSPPWLIRERALRELGRNAVTPGSEAGRALVKGMDDEVLHAAVRRLEGPQREMLLDLLSERLRRFGETGSPDITDPLVRHRVVAAVFGAPDRSPTPLRPIAVMLRDRLDKEASAREQQWGRTVSSVEKRERLDKDALIRGPVERFLARHGDIRK